MGLFRSSVPEPPGHDKVAQFAVFLIKYGRVPEFLAKPGYRPVGKNLARPLKRD
jgi:hypothetical protein